MTTSLSNRQRRERSVRILDRVGFDRSAERLAALPPALWIAFRPSYRPQYGEAR